MRGRRGVARTIGWQFSIASVQVIGGKVVEYWGMRGLRTWLLAKWISKLGLASEVGPVLLTLRMHEVQISILIIQKERLHLHYHLEGWECDIGSHVEQLTSISGLLIKMTFSLSFPEYFITTEVMTEIQENLKRFKITYSQYYIQITPLINTFKTQILINKRTSEIHFEDIKKQFQFSSEYSTKYASLILGLAEIDNDYFLLFVENVYLQPPFPPAHIGIYQIASINYLEYSRVVTNRQLEIINTIKTEIFNFSFYFSFDRDLTLSFQKLKSGLKVKPREAYFWNYSMIRALMVEENQAEEWLIPIIQGHYGAFPQSIGNWEFKYYLISRRSKYRSGTRFYNRGIDENSKCSQFIETEQIIIIGTEILSFVCLSGSAPLFWEQKSQSDKVRLTRNKELSTLPFIEHFNNIKSEFGRVMIINLLEKKKQSENILLQAYEQLVDENSKILNDFVRYVYLDINDAFKTKNYQEIAHLISKIDPILKDFGFFRYEFLKNQVSHLQTGVFRVSCLDCLSRTNKFMQTLCLYIFSEQLYEDRIISEHNSSARIKELLFGEDPYIPSLILNFRNVWEEKADFESMIYSGSRATNGKKNKFLDSLEDSFIALQRLYNQKFIDEIKQKSLDILLYHKHYRMNSMLKNKQNTELHVCLVTWNVNATDPEKLKGLEMIIEQCDDSDLIVFGIQEMIELSTNNVMANNEQESSSSIKWGKMIEKFLNMRPDKKIFVQKVEMVGLMLIMFVSDTWKHSIKSVQKDAVKTGMGGQFGNKGAVVLRVRIFETSLCFICAHLTAGYTKSKERIDDFIQIHKKCFQQNKIGVQNEIEIEESDYRWFFGDLNFRINGEYKEIKTLIEECGEEQDNRKEVISKLIQKDQLSLNKKDPECPPLFANYEENDITFFPTYKLEKATGVYTEEKSRIPSWCDRILFCGSTQPDHSCQCLKYSDIPVTGSDHRPVTAKFRIVINQSVNSSSFLPFK